MQTNPAAEQSKIIRRSESPWNQSGRKVSTVVQSAKMWKNVLTRNVLRILSKEERICWRAKYLWISLPSCIKISLLTLY